MKNRVLFVAPSGYPLGGVATWLDYLAEGLKLKAWPVTIGLVSGEHHDPELYLREHPFDPIEIVRAPTGTVEGRVRALARVIERVGPDLVASVNIPDVFRAVDRLRRCGKRSLHAIMTLHGLQADYFQDIETFGAAIDGVVCTNRLTCELTERISGMDPGRILYAPYGVEVHEIPEEPEATSEVLRILYCGRFDQNQKRVLDLPRILGALDAIGLGYSLTLAGGGPLEDALRRDLAPWVDKDRARFAGSLDPQALAEEYAQADVLLITSSWETGPIVAWEAMAAGTPVVSSRFVGSGTEGALVDGENCLLFPVGDAEAAADRLARVAADAEMRDRLRTAGSMLVKERFTRSNSIDQWATAMQSVLARSPRVAAKQDSPAPRRGRLDRILGARAAESFRSHLARTFFHSGAGAEWPHSYGSNAGQKAFLERATELDRASRKEEPPGLEESPAADSSRGRSRATQ